MRKPVQKRVEKGSRITRQVLDSSTKDRRDRGERERKVHVVADAGHVGQGTVGHTLSEVVEVVG